MVRSLLSLAIVTPVALATEANPIRKVVTMLQNLEAKVQSEGAKEKELHDKYMCYCKNAGGTLAKSIADAETKGPELVSAIEEGIGKLAQLKDDLKAHQNDRAAAKEAMAAATALREKENAAFEATKTDLETNLAALAKATTAIEKGAGGAFLQTEAASSLKSFVMGKNNMYDADRNDILSFLSGSTDYAPASGQITGILKTMNDEMTADLNDATKTEAAAVAAYDELMAAKKKEVEALTGMIEDKLVRVGDLGVEIQQMKNDAGDTGEGLVDDKKFLEDLDKNCAAKQKLFDENVKYRSQELEALADTIKMLNDDDALELFKKTLPGASSFMELKVSSKSMKAEALALIQECQRSNKRRPELDFISLALRGKKIGFEKVIGMIDDLVAELKKEQQDDNNKKEYCDVQFDLADDKKKALEKTVADLETAITEAKENIVTTKEEIDALEDGIRALDKSVAEATEQRKEENEDYKSLMAGNAAAKELIGFAKNRLNKFYNPKLYKPPAAMAQIRAHNGDAPPPPPEAVEAYSKKGEESNGIIAMMDALSADLQKEMTEAEATEKDAQGDYEQFMADSANKRAEDSKTLTDKEGALAQLEEMLDSQHSEKSSTEKTLEATNSYIASLHAECDWLVKYFDMRKEARDNEIDALEKAKAVLSGADYGLVQTKAKHFLRK
jgi:predicted  nucleic acid-binding Zn-ribbon protein